MKKGKKKRKPWLRFRHRVVVLIARLILTPYIRWRYRLSVRRLPRSDRRNYLVLMNHQTAFDQFFAGMPLRCPMYFVASEDLFSKGWISRLLSFLVAPIPIRKSMTDVRAVMTCKRVAREGGAVVIAPEGNRTYGGRPCYIKPSIAGLVRALGLPVAIFRIEGGYGLHPRWADKVRRGKMTAGISRIIEQEEVASLNDTELYELIKQELYVDEMALGGRYTHKRSAEYLERAMYYCPTCGISRFESRGTRITCLGCGKSIEYLPTLKTVGVGHDFPYANIADWYDGQCDYMNALDLTPYTDTPLTADTVALYEVTPYKNKKKLSGSVTVSVYADRFCFQGGDLSLTVPFSELLAACVLGRNKLNLYRGERILQVKGDKRFNAVKYMNTYYRAKNLKEGTPDAKFLGI